MISNQHCHAFLNTDEDYFLVLLHNDPDADLPAVTIMSRTEIIAKANERIEDGEHLVGLGKSLSILKNTGFLMRIYDLDQKLEFMREAAQAGVLDQAVLLVAKTVISKDVPRKVVCAANISSEHKIIVGVRHWDSLMHAQSHPLSNGEHAFSTKNQGFIDQHGVFMDRTEAWKVAVNAGQIVRRVGGDESGGGTLYSENLY